MLKTHDIHSAAAICQCHPDSIYKAIRSGELKSRKVGRKWIITEENLLAFLNAPPTTSAAKSGTCVLPPTKPQFTDLRALLLKKTRKNSKSNLKKVSGNSNPPMEEGIYAINAAERTQRRKEFRERQRRLSGPD